MGRILSDKVMYLSGIFIFILFTLRGVVQGRKTHETKKKSPLNAASQIGKIV